MTLRMLVHVFHYALLLSSMPALCLSQSSPAAPIKPQAEVQALIDKAEKARKEYQWQGAASGAGSADKGPLATGQSR